MPVVNYHTANGMMIGETTDGVATDYLTDALGSVTATLDENGDVLNRYQHKPYGSLLEKTGSAPDPKFLWVGSLGYRTTNRARSSHYVRARHYSDAQGAWTTVDPRWPSESSYGYASNKPVTEIDPSGRAPFQGSGPPGTICPPSQEAARRMIEQAYRRGGPNAVRATLALLRRCSPHIAAAVTGWAIGRFIDERCGISGWIINQIWPDDLPADPNPNRNYANCSDEELRNRQRHVDKKCKRNGSQIRFDCHKIKDKKLQNACAQLLEACIRAREAVCECFIGGCDKIHQDMIDRLKKQRR